MTVMRGSFWAALGLVACTSAMAQRMQFPSMVPGGATVQTPPPAPMATLEGAIQAPPPTWDPYAPPVDATPSLLPQDPYYSTPGSGFSPQDAFATMQKFRQDIRLDYSWFARGGDHGLGINEFQTSATFAIPFLYNSQTPLLITPGFGIHIWDGPISDPAAAFPADMPGQTYDAYLAFNWNPQVTPWLSGELSFSIGAYSDFHRWVDRAVRFIGGGVGVLTFSPSFRLKLGAMYLDRVRVKVLPVGGLVWTPTPDIVFDILFPNPRIARRLNTIGNIEWWGYVRGDYGGGSWSIVRAPESAIPGQSDMVDYNDIRIALGVEFKRPEAFNGLFEVGFAFERELVYASRIPLAFHPDPTVFLRTAIAF